MSSLFPRVRAIRLGYHPAQVDTFFERSRRALEQPGSEPGFDTLEVRRAAFNLKRHGYHPATVDQALDRLEGALLAREREDFVRTHGQEAWMQSLAERAQELYPRLRRPRGARFAPPRGLRRGYDRRQVDRLVDRITAFFDTGQALTASDLRAATFQRRARWSAYDERVVDAYLARAMDILLGTQ